MNELHSLRILFSISILWSFLLIVYDIVMVKKGLYRKWLKKNRRIVKKNYHNLSFTIDLIFAILVVVVIGLMVNAGVTTRKCLYFNYIFSSIIVLAIPSWLIVSHLIRFSYDQGDKKQEE